MSAEELRPVIHVVAGAVTDGAGRVLIAQRPKGTHLAGGWEFPGGKLEPGEDRRAGLARELREELGIAIGDPRPLIRLRHAYPEREVLLDVWVVRHYSGVPRGLEAQALRWCTQNELETVQLLPADGPIVRALRLPERLVVASSANYVVNGSATVVQEQGPRLRGTICSDLIDARAAAPAADFLVLRDAATPVEIASFCAQVCIPVFARSSREISLEQVWALGATGTHDLEL
ncbi:MAG TPA: NUDIX domain-containing protein [Steroidobacteraceae bacterium]